MTGPPSKRKHVQYQRRCEGSASAQTSSKRHCSTCPTDAMWGTGGTLDIFDQLVHIRISMNLLRFQQVPQWIPVNPCFSWFILTLHTSNTQKCQPLRLLLETSTTFPRVTKADERIRCCLLSCKAAPSSDRQHSQKQSATAQGKGMLEFAGWENHQQGSSQAVTAKKSSTAADQWNFKVYIVFIPFLGTKTRPQCCNLPMYECALSHQLSKHALCVHQATPTWQILTNGCLW